MENCNSMLRGFEEDAINFLFLSMRIFNCLLCNSFTRKYKDENVVFYSRSTSHFYFLHCSSFQKQIFPGYSLVFCIEVVLRLDLVHSKHRNTEWIRRSIKSLPLSQLSRNATLWKIFYLTYNQFHKFLRLFDVLPNFPFTISETLGDYYL